MSGSIVDDKYHPAFPIQESMSFSAYPGMTLQEYAAIKLKVPNSGNEWLDEMIKQSLRNDFAARAMEAEFTNITSLGQFKDCAYRSYKMADEMLKYGEKKL